LVKERLEEIVITAIDDGHRCLRVAQSLRAGKAAEASANDHDTWCLRLHGFYGQ
jgi:hypothetical protein